MLHYRITLFRSFKYKIWTKKREKTKHYRKICKVHYPSHRSRIHLILRTITADEIRLTTMCNRHPEDCRQGNDLPHYLCSSANTLISMTCSAIQLPCAAVPFSLAFVNRNASKRVSWKLVQNYSAIDIITASINHRVSTDYSLDVKLNYISNVARDAQDR